MNSRPSFVCVLLALFASVFGSAVSIAANPSTLSPGVFIDQERAQAVIADPAGFAQGLALEDGRALWRSREQAFPLTVVEGQLLALGASRQFGVGMLLLLDPGSGVTLDRIAFDLPETVSADVTPKPGRQFTASVEHRADGVRLHWRSEVRSLRGALIADPATGRAPTPEVESGAVDFALGGASAFAVSVRELVAAPALLIEELDRSERFGAVAGRQFRSADGQAVLASVATADDSPFDYRWQVISSGGAVLGSLRAPTSRADFLQIDSRLYYRATAFGYRDAGDRWVEAPLRLTAFDLSSGVELWSAPILDRVYRGTLPP